jgi:cyclopropane-fatty-acyl-phospholipid synthase
MNVAGTVEPLIRAAVGAQIPIQIRCWDGSAFGPPDADVQVDLVNRRALRRLLWAPNELGFARAYVSGDVLLSGDILAMLDVLERVALPENGPGIVVDRNTQRRLARALLRLGIVGPPPKPPAEEASRRNHRHTRTSDLEAVTHHYDVGNDFYRIVLGESMTYSCAYWPQNPGPGYTLSDAQLAKCHLVASKLGLSPDMRVLDVGCGWGTFALVAAERYGARVVGVTLSESQASYARKRVADAGFADRVEIRIQDYRDVDDGPYDAIASIGMAEHVGKAMLPTYSAQLLALLRPSGRLLNHAISRRPGPQRRPTKNSFIDRFVFPDGEILPLAEMVEALETAGFEVRDVESLREHYALTLREWVGNLERRWDEAVAASSPGRSRVWRLYMAGSALAFEANRIGVNQVLAVKPGNNGRSGMPRTRAGMLAAPG